MIVHRLEICHSKTHSFQKPLARLARLERAAYCLEVIKDTFQQVDWGAMLYVAIPCSTNKNMDPTHLPYISKTHRFLL